MLFLDFFRAVYVTFERNSYERFQPKFIHNKEKKAVTTNRSRMAFSFKLDKILLVVNKTSKRLNGKSLFGPFTLFKICIKVKSLTKSHN